MYDLLDFDTALFGYNVAQIKNTLHYTKLPQLLQELQGHDIRLAYWFVPPTDAQKNLSAMEHSGVFVDVKVVFRTYIKPKAYTSANPRVYRIRGYEGKTPSRSLLALTMQSGIYSRFATDTHFVHNEFEKLYTTWIEKSVQHTLGWEVLTYTDTDGEVKGLITMESVGKKGKIGLLAVDSAFRGKSIGTALVKEAFVRFEKHGIKDVTVTTQKKNVTACKFYESLGFKKVNTENVYHFWL